MNELGLDEESLRHLCKKTETEYDQLIESLSDAKYLLKEKAVIKRLFTNNFGSLILAFLYNFCELLV
jgi:hypothetical protein